MPPRVAIVGAGIGGLAAAHRLSRAAAEQGRPIEITVLEASDRPGGVLATETCEGVLLERGPDTLVTHKPAGLALCDRLGFADRIVYPESGHIDILDGGRLLPMPAGFALLAPTRWQPLLSSPLLSWRGKLRALAEPLVPPRSAPSRPEQADESVASFVRRRFGQELYRRLSEPVVGGITMADVENLSLAATFPRLAGLEQEPGRVSGGWRRRVVPSGAPGGPRKGAPPPTATLCGGLGQLVDALVERLPAGSLRLGQPVQGLVRQADGFLLKLVDGRSLPADAVLIAIPAHAAASIFSDLDPSLAEGLGKISYASCVTVNLAWPRASVERPPHGHGFFVPRTAGLAVVAATFVNVKFPERVPADLIVARVFLGGALHPDALGGTDTDLVDLAARTLTPLLGLRQPPLWSRVWRHPMAIPQRPVGHPALTGRLTTQLAQHPGLEFAGGPLGAYGLPDSIAAGEAAAERVLGWVGSR
ncbi:MAG TPA: protoporphyrinogen oxidase [Thermoanaerobaculia bacterium]|jgi:oxygen-dependent protoporphyrinogen oxidase|nr:protoporphyrinogen oxidase [Thermoanaerobaculia bacterium]